jgi:hypothetical protein
MSNVIKFNFRRSDFILDRDYNPTRSLEFGAATARQLEEACGLIPDFFADACSTVELNPSLEAIAADMDATYQFGGFAAYPFPGSITDAGVYQSADGDDDMPPLAVFRCDGFECFVYQYAITAIRDMATRETKIARFD